MMLVLHYNTELYYISIMLTATVECVWFWDSYTASPAQYSNVQLSFASESGCLFAIYLIVCKLLVI